MTTSENSIKETLKAIVTKMTADVKGKYSAESSAKDIFISLKAAGFTDKGANMMIEQAMKLVIG